MDHTLSIPFSPGIISFALLNKSPEAIFPLSHATTTYWYGGAQAIYQGVRSLGSANQLGIYLIYLRAIWNLSRYELIGRFNLLHPFGQTPASSID